MVEKWICWIPVINNRFKLNSMVQDFRIRVLWVGLLLIRDSNDIIKMATCRYLGKASINLTECMTLRDGIELGPFELGD